MREIRRDRRFTRPVPCLVLMTAAVIVIVTAGCGDGRPKRVPVSGQVLIDGQPLTYGFIRLEPEGNRSATGEIGPDGRFTLTTFEKDDGAVPGAHPAMILAAEAISSTKQKWHAPKRYANAKLSGLIVTIDGPTNDLKVKLSWDGGKPFVENVAATE